jgi:transcriptional regulator GlxA family with amidase domain
MNSIWLDLPGVPLSESPRRQAYIYVIEVVTNADRLTVEGEDGVLTFMAKHHFNKVTGACCSVLLACGMGSRSVRDARSLRGSRRWAAEVRRLGTVCVGACLLAEAGLLNEPRATTHWRFGRNAYPSVRVQHDALWVKDGNMYTSAGISAGIDLALAWVDHLPQSEGCLRLEVLMGGCP